MSQSWKLVGGTIELDETSLTIRYNPALSRWRELRIPLSALEAVETRPAGFLVLKVAGDTPPKKLGMKDDPLYVSFFRRGPVKELVAAVTSMLQPSPIVDEDLVAKLADARARRTKDDEPAALAEAAGGEEGSATSQAASATKPQRKSRVKSGLSSVMNEVKYSFTGAVATDPQERADLVARYVQAAAAELGVTVHTAPVPDLDHWMGYGLMRSGRFSRAGAWYVEEDGLYFWPPPVLPGHTVPPDLIPQYATNSHERALRVLDWSETIAIVIDGQEATTSTSTVRGRQRQPLRVMSSTIDETVTTAAEAHTTVAFERRSGADLVLTVEVSPAEVRSRLAAPIAQVRREQRNDATASGGSATPVAEQLTQLASLLERGLLTMAEFESQKAQLLRGSTA